MSEVLILEVEWVAKAAEERLGLGKITLLTPLEASNERRWNLNYHWGLGNLECGQCGNIERKKNLKSKGELPLRSEGEKPGEVILYHHSDQN